MAGCAACLDIDADSGWRMQYGASGWAEHAIATGA
jgi:hypothetical protein